jgi:hypothetical protein
VGLSESEYACTECEEIGFQLEPIQEGINLGECQCIFLFFISESFFAFLSLEYNLYLTEDEDRFNSIPSVADTLQFDSSCTHSPVENIGERIENCSGIQLPANTQFEDSKNFGIYLALFIDEEDFSQRRYLDESEPILLDHTVII